MSWAEKPIKGVLCDITGVLYDGALDSGVPVTGSVKAVKKLTESGIPVRYVSNESSVSMDYLIEKMESMRLHINREHIFTPAPAVKKLLKERGLRPFIMVSKEAKSDYADVDQTQPHNAVLLTDAQFFLNYPNMCQALKVLIEVEGAPLISLGAGRYYKDKGGNLNLDVGAFSKVLEYSARVKAEIVGKPEPSFFMAALDDMGLKPEDVVMIGDDLEGDVGGAQRIGARGVQVRTGKFLPRDEDNKSITPDGRVENLSEAVDVIVKQWEERKAE